jgi:hypothetical protein
MTHGGNAMGLIQEGVGGLIRPLDIKDFREWNRKKPKGMVDKRMTEAVARFVHDGDCIGTELYGTVHCPQSLVNEIVR